MPAAPRPGSRAAFASRAKLPTDKPPAPTAPGKQPRNPLHGLTLEAIVTALAAHYGWAGLAQRIPLSCFESEPSVASSLKFLRKTPWARAKVESLYLFMQREGQRARKGTLPTPPIDSRQSGAQ